MGWEHESETVRRAEELYCVDRLSFDRVAEVTEVAASTLKRWAERDRWREKREEIARIESNIRINTIKGRAAVLERLLLAEDGKEASQVAFAVASLESLALKQQELVASGKIPSLATSGPKPRMENREDMAKALRLAVETRLVRLLTNEEGVNLAALKDVLACMDLLARYAKPEGENIATALSEESAASLREALGL